MAASAVLPKPSVAVGLVELTLPDPGFALQSVEFEPGKYLVGYDPARLPLDLVLRWIDEDMPAGYTLVQGVPQ